MTRLRIRSGSANIAAEIAGEGPPLVFLHAGVADRRMWQRQVEAFAARYTAIAYDRRGFGDTTCEPEPHSHVNDLAAVFAATVRQPPVLVGCSQGGRVAIDYALAHREAVAALVLVAPAVSGAPGVEYPDGPIGTLMKALEEAEDADDLDRVNLLEAHMWLDGPNSREGRVAGSARELFLDMNGRALRAPPTGEEIGSSDAYARLGELAMPVLLVCGDLDFPHLRERCAHLRSAIQQIEFVEMSGTAHLPSLEQPERFNAILADFLRRVQALPPDS